MSNTVSYSIRQFSAVCCAATLAWDYCRAPEVLGALSTWTLMLHFIYFQLPLKSNAIPFFHATSWIGASVIPMCYLHLLFWNPSLEINHVDSWDETFYVLIVRSFMVNFIPLFMHALDIAVNQTNLIISYQKKNYAFMMAWSLLSFGSLSVIYEFTFPDFEELGDLQGISIKHYHWQSKAVSLLASLFSYFILYQLIIQRARHQHQHHHHHQPSSPVHSDSNNHYSSNNSSNSSRHHKHDSSDYSE